MLSRCRLRQIIRPLSGSFGTPKQAEWQRGLTGAAADAAVNAAMERAITPEVVEHLNTNVRQRLKAVLAHAIATVSAAARNWYAGKGAGP